MQTHNCNIRLSEIKVITAECSGNFTERVINFKVGLEGSFQKMWLVGTPLCKEVKGEDLRVTSPFVLRQTCWEKLSPGEITFHVLCAAS